MLKDIENLPRGSRLPRSEVLAGLRLNADGLIPAIAQQHDTGEVLMMAWMNREALEETLATGRVCYFSRSRGRLWRKGESSGQVQHLKGLYIDCDGDTLLLRVDQTGPACHTGRSNCFFFRVDGDEVAITANPLIDPEALYGSHGASGAGGQPPKEPQ
ncbi:MAG: phosphoribosyl-AMP cyclohydrolase [Thioalkalivibrio sp.]|nr:MAG: phosphoribosyl-AMP cyclohydrolase [Thioalkalivibrio sp.]